MFLRDPRRVSRDSPKFAAWILTTFFGIVFLVLFCVRLCVDFGAILASTPLPKSTQNRQKSMKNCIKLSIDFLIIFVMASVSIFGPFCLEVGGPRYPQTIKNLKVFNSFGYFGTLANKRLQDRIFGQLGPQIEAPSPPKSIKSRSKIEQSWQSNFD